MGDVRGRSPVTKRWHRCGVARWTALTAVAGLMFAGGQPLAAADEAPVPASRTTSDDVTPDQADTPESLAVAQARKSGKEVNVASLEDESSEVTAKPDGSLVSTIHTKPVRTRQDGAWRDIDTRLQSTADGAIAPKAAMAGLEFSGGGSGPLVRMARAGKELTLTWPNPLPVPVVNDSTAEYRSILPDVDLRMTATEGGFTQLIVVKTPAAAKNPALDQLKLGLTSADLSVRANPDGSLSAVDKAAGGTVFTAPKPMMFDSTPGLLERSGAPVQASKTQSRPAVTTATADETAAHAAPVGVTVSTDQKSLVLTPNQALLDATATIFPVLIDPNWDTPRTVGWAGISRYWGGNSYWKFSGDFGTGYCGDIAHCAPADLKRVLYSIPVGGRAFAGKHILSAKFNAYETHSYSCTKKPLQLYATARIGSGTTWDNSSSASFWTQHLQTVDAAFGWGTSCAAGYVEFGGTTSNALRDKVQQAANANWTDLTLGLRAQDEGDDYAWKRFSSDASIQIQYNLPPRQSPMRYLSMSPGSACTTSSVAIIKLP